MIKLPKILPQPSQKPWHLPNQIKWLSGEGAGSWFLIESTSKEHFFKVTRFSPEGKTECEGIFKSDKHLELNEEFVLDYPSHCAKVTVSQLGEVITLLASDLKKV